MNKNFLVYGAVGWLAWWMLMVALDGLTPQVWEVIFTAACVVCGAMVCERIPDNRGRERAVDWEIETEDVWDE